MRWLWTALIFCLTLYAPLELSRLIIVRGPDAEQIFELVFFWTLYIVGMVIVYRFTKGR